MTEFSFWVSVLALSPGPDTGIDVGAKELCTPHSPSPSRKKNVAQAFHPRVLRILLVINAIENRKEDKHDH